MTNCFPCSWRTFPGLTDRGPVLDRDKRKEIVIERPAGCPGVNYAEGDYELEKQLHDMDLAGIDKGL